MSKPIAVLGLIMMLIFVYQSLSYKQEMIVKDPTQAAAPESQRETNAKPSSTKPLTTDSWPSRSAKKAESASKDQSSTADTAPAEPTPAPPIANSPESERNNSETDTSSIEVQPGDKKMTFDIKSYGIDEILALPQEEKLRFLEKNQLKEPENFTRFRYLSDPKVVDTMLKGQYKGKFETVDGKDWTLALKIDGQMEGEHFNGELGIELFNASNEAVARSTTSGPLDEHVRVIEQGDKYSLLIQPNTGADSASMYQIFIGQDNRTMLAGNYYQKKEDGKLELLGPFVLKRSGGENNKPL